jgi:hypothetical protein
LADIVLPYRTPSSTSVLWSDPEILDGDIWLPLVDTIEGWDPSRDVVIRGELTLDVPEVELGTGLRSDEVALSVSWTNSSSRHRAAAPTQPIDPTGHIRYEVRLPGDEIDGTVGVRLALVARPSGATATGTARRPGSILAERTFSIALEGDVGMFAVRMVDFASTKIPTRASWHLDVSQDLDQMFVTGYMLHVNTRDTELKSAIETRNPTERELALIQELEEGVMGVLVESASLLQQELTARTDWEPDTVGHVLRSILQRGDDLGAMPTEPSELAMWRSRIIDRVRTMGIGRNVT